MNRAISLVFLNPSITNYCKVSCKSHYPSMMDWRKKKTWSIKQIFFFLILELVSSAFALLFTEISVPLTTEISVKNSAKANETSFSQLNSYFSGVLLGIWKPLTPSKVCDWPLGVMDASTFNFDLDIPFENTINFILMTFYNLAGGIAHSPSQKWYYYPFQTN